MTRNIYACMSINSYTHIRNIWGCKNFHKIHRSLVNFSIIHRYIKYHCLVCTRFLKHSTKDHRMYPFKDKEVSLWRFSTMNQDFLIKRLHKYISNYLLHYLLQEMYIVYIYMIVKNPKIITFDSQTQRSLVLFFWGFTGTEFYKKKNRHFSRL